MNFSIDRWSAKALRGSLLGLSVAATVLLASCGGGGGSGSSYVPGRIAVFGDEASLITGQSSATALDGKKYTINGFTSGTTTPDCRVNLTWAQRLAAGYGLIFADCNPDGATPTAVNYSTAGAKVADVLATIRARVADGSVGLTSSTLIAVMVGTNDVKELYAGVGNASLAKDSKGKYLDPTVRSALQTAADRGDQLGKVFSEITDRKNKKARALYVLIPNVGDTPFAYDQEAIRAGNRELLKALTDAFNDQLRLSVPNNGNSVGQVDANLLFKNVVKDPKSAANAAGIVDVKSAACDPARTDPLDVTTCTSSTLVTGTAVNSLDPNLTYLWAQDVYLGPVGHGLLADRAFGVIYNNPF